MCHPVWENGWQLPVQQLSSPQPWYPKPNLRTRKKRWVAFKIYILHYFSSDMPIILPRICCTSLKLLSLAHPAASLYLDRNQISFKLFYKSKVLDIIIIRWAQWSGIQSKLYLITTVLSIIEGIYPQRSLSLSIHLDCTKVWRENSSNNGKLWKDTFGFETLASSKEGWTVLFKKIET